MVIVLRSLPCLVATFSGVEFAPSYTCSGRRCCFSAKRTKLLQSFRERKPSITVTPPGGPRSGAGLPQHSPNVLAERHGHGASGAKRRVGTYMRSLMVM